MQNHRTVHSRRLFALVLAATVCCSAQAGGKANWFDDLMQLRANPQTKSPGAVRRTNGPGLGSRVYTFAVWIKTQKGGPLLASCPPYGDWNRDGKVLSVNSALFFEGRGVGRMRGRKRIKDGKWHHVAFVGGKPHRMYVDGKPDSSKEMKHAPDVKSHIVKIGYVTHDYPWFERPADFFVGSVDDLRYYDRSLSDDEIAALARGKEPTGPKPVSHWTFDKDGRDSTGHNHALLSKGAALIPGKIGQAVKLDNSAHIAIFQGDSFARTVWRLGERPNDPAVRKQVRWALEDGILTPDLTTVSLKEAAQRYCKAISQPRSWRTRAQTLAAKVSSVSDLKAIHAIYLESKPYSFTFSTLDAALSLAKKTLEMVEAHAPRPDMRKSLAALARQVTEAGEHKSANIAKLRSDILALRRRIIFSHPALAFDKLLVNKRSGALRGHMVDQYLGRHSTPGSGLTLVESWKDSPRAKPLLTDKLPTGTTFHPDISYDGGKVIFSFCAHGEMTGKQTKNSEAKKLLRFWIYEAATDGSWIKQLTGNSADPLKTWDDRHTVLVEDWDPCYLPDGGFAFVSTRSQGYGRCHGARYAPAYLLYRADEGGANIRQLSYGEANEWDPAVLNDGRIVFSRWDYIDRNNTIFQSLWTTRPDGTATAHFYGNYTPGPCMLAESAPIPGSPQILSTATDHHGSTKGSILMIDPRRGLDGPKPLRKLTPELGFLEGRPPAGTRETPMPLHGMDVGRGRKAATPFPLTEEMFLVAMQTEVKGKYAIYLADTLGGRELIYSDENEDCFAPLPVAPRKKPPALPCFLPEKPKGKSGTFFVQNIYVSAQPLKVGSIKHLRINKIVGQPTRGVTHRSYVGDEIAKQVLGTTPVAADGSAYFSAPAGVPLQFQALDEKGMAVLTMRSLVYLHPGEHQGCVGCHEPKNATAPPMRRRPATPPSTITPPVGPAYAGGLSFVTRVQPVLDRYCIGCHGLGEKPAGDLTLTGKSPAAATGKKQKKGQTFSLAYKQLLARPGLIRTINHQDMTHFSKPKDYFAHASKLAPMLLAGHPDKDGKKRVTLDDESWRRIVDWLDLNAQFYGDYSNNRLNTREVSPEGEKALRAHIAKTFGDKLAAQPLETLVNRGLITESRILKAPLAKSAGGWQQIPNGWNSTADRGYKEMLAIAKKVFKPLEHHDIAGTCGRDEKCKCGNCWIRLERKRYLTLRKAGTR
ncbi:MAG: hypothetical protein QGG42_04905 [Phycisphaerae bacterium]|nr:hypothetical protein [Phycisphaerae bacterium]